MRTFNQVSVRVLLGILLGGLVSCTGSPSEPSATANGSSESAASPTVETEPGNIASSDASSGSLASSSGSSSATVPRPDTCEIVESGFGPPGDVSIQAEEVVSGLDVPWGIAFLPDGDMLVTERSGRVRLVENGQLLPEPVADISATARGEGGLLGIAAHPNFDSNRLFYLYYTTDSNGSLVNRVEQWRLSDDSRSASAQQTILDNIPVARFHNGGRIRFGPDGMLYIGTGDARDPDSAQNVESLAGKILRLTPEGDVPDDNPFPGNPVYILGIRNTQGFDWLNNSTLWVTDHGPSGELGRSGHDEVSVARAGDNLGWPTIYGCQSQGDLIRPMITWEEAVPPGGAAIYTGDAIPGWQGSLIMGTLGSRHLHRVVMGPDGELQRHGVYLQGEYGRLREVVMGPDGDLYVTTSNCDGRGNCPPGGDKILRITQ